ncbi:unnamed protein product [Amoebophrya sp. A120]|nr:unnamed protein product [Amoebophrya sp. A120]|eukprot:GSA120T00001063001.1
MAGPVEDEGEADRYEDLQGQQADENSSLYGTTSSSASDVQGKTSSHPPGRNKKEKNQLDHAGAARSKKTPAGTRARSTKASSNQNHHKMKIPTSQQENASFERGLLLDGDDPDGPNKVKLFTRRKTADSFSGYRSEWERHFCENTSFLTGKRDETWNNTAGFGRRVLPSSSFSSYGDNVDEADEKSCHKEPHKIRPCQKYSLNHGTEPQPQPTEFFQSMREQLRYEIWCPDQHESEYHTSSSENEDDVDHNLQAKQKIPRKNFSEFRRPVCRWSHTADEALCAAMKRIVFKLQEAMEQTTGKSAAEIHPAVDSWWGLAKTTFDLSKWEQEFKPIAKSVNQAMRWMVQKWNLGDLEVNEVDRKIAEEMAALRRINAEKDKGKKNNNSNRGRNTKTKRDPQTGRYYNAKNKNYPGSCDAEKNIDVVDEEKLELQADVDADLFEADDDLEDSVEQALVEVEQEEEQKNSSFLAADDDHTDCSAAENAGAGGDINDGGKRNVDRINHDQQDSEDDDDDDDDDDTIMNMKPSPDQHLKEAEIPHRITEAIQLVPDEVFEENIDVVEKYESQNENIENENDGEKKSKTTREKIPGLPNKFYFTARDCVQRFEELLYKREERSKNGDLSSHQKAKKNATAAEANAITADYEMRPWTAAEDEQLRSLVASIDLTGPPRQAQYWPNFGKDRRPPRPEETDDKLYHPNRREELAVYGWDDKFGNISKPQLNWVAITQQLGTKRSVWSVFTRWVRALNPHARDVQQWWSKTDRKVFGEYIKQNWRQEEIDWHTLVQLLAQRKHPKTLGEAWQHYNYPKHKWAPDAANDLQTLAFFYGLDRFQQPTKKNSKAGTTQSQLMKREQRKENKSQGRGDLSGNKKTPVPSEVFQPDFYLNEEREVPRSTTAVDHSEQAGKMPRSGLESDDAQQDASVAKIKRNPGNKNIVQDFLYDHYPDVKKSAVQSKLSKTKSYVQRQIATLRKAKKNKMNKKSKKQLQQKIKQNLLNFQFGGRREMHHWSEEQDQHLAEAVKKFKPGNWKKINDYLRDNYNIFTSEQDVIRRFNLRNPEGMADRHDKLNITHLVANPCRVLEHGHKRAELMRKQQSKCTAAEIDLPSALLANQNFNGVGGANSCSNQTAGLILNVAASLATSTRTGEKKDETNHLDWLVDHQRSCIGNYGSGDHSDIFSPSLAPAPLEDGDVGDDTIVQQNPKNNSSSHCTTLVALPTTSNTMVIPKMSNKRHRNKKDELDLDLDPEIVRLGAVSSSSFEDEAVDNLIVARTNKQDKFTPYDDPEDDIVVFDEYGQHINAKRRKNNAKNKNKCIPNPAEVARMSLMDIVNSEYTLTEKKAMIRKWTPHRNERMNETLRKTCLRALEQESRKRNSLLGKQSRAERQKDKELLEDLEMLVNDETRFKAYESSGTRTSSRGEVVQAGVLLDAPGVQIENDENFEDNQDEEAAGVHHVDAGALCHQVQQQGTIPVQSDNQEPAGGDEFEDEEFSEVQSENEPQGSALYSDEYEDGDDNCYDEDD